MLGWVSVAAVLALPAGVTAAGSGPMQAISPPGEFDPGDPPLVRFSSDEAAVVRGPEFVRGAARSGDSLIAASRGRTCAVRGDGDVTCWGMDGARERLSVAGLANVVSVTSGDHLEVALHVCALHSDGTVSCWGPGRMGQLGGGEMHSSYLPVQVLGLSDAVALAAGSEHTCAVHATGRVSCWGSGLLGQLGHPNLTPVSSPQQVPNLSDVEKIDAGPTSSCAVHSGGGLTCWGSGGGAGNVHTFTPGRVDGLPAVVAVSTGWDRTCAVAVVGEVYCWPAADVARPERVDGVTGAVSISVGDGGVCVVHDDGGVSCWGEQNAAGQLGNGTRSPQPRPARIPGVGAAVAVTMSVGSDRIGAHTCVAHEDASYSCWGGNRAGQLGDGTSTGRPYAAAVITPAPITGDRIPRDATDLLRTWLDEVVRQREREYPWLRASWDHVRELTSAVPLDSISGIVQPVCDGPGEPSACRAESMMVSELELGTVVHELAHVYDATTGLAQRRAWGAVQLYFGIRYPDCFRDHGQRPGSEILADTLTHLVVPLASLAYFETGCPGLGDQPDREAEEVVLSGLAGEVPDWYTDNVTNGAGLWALLRRVLSPILLASLASEFGGLCSTDWVGFPPDWSLVPPAGANPFRSGGC